MLKFSVIKIKKVVIINSVVPILPNKETINFVLSIPFPPASISKNRDFSSELLFELKK